jgi:hypothetical protein
VPSDGASFSVYQYTRAAWREVISGHVYTKDSTTGKLAWMPLWDHYQAPPKNVRGINATVSGGTLMWDAPDTRTTDYQVIERVGTAITRYYPSENGWTPQLSMAISAQNPDTDYNYTVIARRVNSGGGPPIRSVESAKATLSTGHPAKPQVVTNQVVTVQPSKTDSWSSDELWKQQAGNVQQGYGTNSARNSHGAVAYSTAYTQLATKLNFTENGKTVPVVDHITLSNAVITRVYRASSPGTGNPRVEGHAWKSDFRTAARPRDTDFPSSNGNFTAPDTGDAKENFKFLNPDDTSQNMLLYWANQWVKKAPTYDGILIFRTDGGGNSTAGYNGLCTFRGNTYSTDWQLTLTVSWNFNFPEALAAKWTPGG